MFRVYLHHELRRKETAQSMLSAILSIRSSFDLHVTIYCACSPSQIAAAAAPTDHAITSRRVPQFQDISVRSDAYVPRTLTLHRQRSNEFDSYKSQSACSPSLHVHLVLLIKKTHYRPMLQSFSNTFSNPSTIHSAP